MKIDEKLDPPEMMTALLIALDKLKEQVGGVQDFQLMFDAENPTNLEEVL
jgi:hypothetical protein